MNDSNVTVSKQKTLRYPAEFEPVQCVFVCEPHATDTWYHAYDQALAEFRHFKSALKKVIPVIDLHTDWQCPTHDAWVRDYGPIFTLHHNQCHIQDFTFNGWGLRYQHDYPLDNAIPASIAARLQLPHHRHEMVLEGGAIETNGQGTVLLSEDCLLDPMRNPGMTKHKIEQRLYSSLGIQYFHWINGSLAGDDTCGHVDQLARFITPDTIVIASTDQRDPTHPDARTLLHLRNQIKGLHQPDNTAYQILELPIPTPRFFDYPDTHPWEAEHPQVPMSYTNFLMVNDHLFVPTFNDPQDARAIELLQKTLPDKQIIPIASQALAIGRGSLHCLSMTKPAVKIDN